MARRRAFIILTGTIVVLVVLAAMTTTSTKPFPCEEFLRTAEDHDVHVDPRGVGCLFRTHVDDGRVASIAQEGRIQRDTDTVLWSLFGNAFAANPNTPYLYTTLPLVSINWLRWLPFSSSKTTQLSFLPSPMWRFSHKEDLAVFIGKLPPSTVYMGFTTFCLWRPFRFVFASLGDSWNGLTLKHDPKTRLFAYVICFANNNTDDSNNSTRPATVAYNAVMEALVASGLPESAINVQALDPQVLSSEWAYYELVLRIFHFHNQTEGTHYLQSHAHNHPFYYVSADQKMHQDEDPSDDDDTCDSNTTSGKKWRSLPSKPTGFKSPFHSESIRERERLTPAFLEFGKEVLSDIHRLLSASHNRHENDVPATQPSESLVPSTYNYNYNYTTHSFGPLYVAEGTDCLKHDTECLGGCPDAAYFGLNVEDDDNTTATNYFETLPSWPTRKELHVVTLVDHRVFNNSVYGSLALLASSSRVLDPRHLTKHVRATSVGVTSLDLFGNDEIDAGEDAATKSPKPFAAWVFTRNPEHCRRLSMASSNNSRYIGCTHIDSSHLSSSNKYVTYLERIYLNPLTGTRPDYDSILPARWYRVVLDDEITKEERHSIADQTEPFVSQPIQKKDDASLSSTTNNNLPFSKIKLPPAHSVAIFDGDEPLRFLHIIKTGGESLENYVWKEPSLRIDYGACFVAASKATNWSSSSLPTRDSMREKLCNGLATLTSSALCGLNCECCASDLFARDEQEAATVASWNVQTNNNNSKSDSVRRRQGAFHGTLLRSPRAHVLSQFSHCHAAHHSSWGRILRDVPLYAAEGILRMTEQACRSSCETEGDADWFQALQKRLEVDERIILPYYDSKGNGHDHDDDRDEDSTNGENDDEAENRVLVISIHNTQSHALTCGKSKGSFGHHFRRIIPAQTTTRPEHPDSSNKKYGPPTRRQSQSQTTHIDEYTPSLHEALAALDRFEWFGITELFMPSLCLLHYQANADLPSVCDCDFPDFVQHDSPGALGYWKETRSTKRTVEELTPRMLQQIDDHTHVDAALYAQAVRIFLGKLRSVEEATGTALLKCIQWDKFRAKTEYLTELWNDGPKGLLI